MRKNNQPTSTDKYILLALVVICILLMGLSLFTDKVGGPLRVIANYTIAPMQKGINTIGAWTNDLTRNFETLQEMRAENKKLQKKVADLSEKNNTLQQEKYELDRLRELFALDQKYGDYEKVGARVIAGDSGNWFHSFIIDKGSKDGIRVDMNVIAASGSGAEEGAAGGLAGIVVEVGSNWARVRSIIDDSSNVSALVLSTSDKCIVSGDLKTMQEGKIPFEQLANNDSDIKVGEQVVTSHISSKYLPGIFIGYISEIKVDSNNLTRSGYITPVVDFQHLQEVLVITTMKEQLSSK